MSGTTGETWAVVDEAGVRHEVDVSEGRTGSPPWVAHVADGTARRSLVSARDAVVLMAQARGWSIVEVLAPGQVSRAAALADAFARGADLQRGLIRAFATSADPAEIDAVMSPVMPDDLGAEVPARRLLDAVASLPRAVAARRLRLDDRERLRFATAREDALCRALADPVEGGDVACGEDHA